MLKKYKLLYIYILGLHIVIYFLLTLQNQISTPFKIILLGLHLLMTYFFIRKNEKSKEDQNKNYKEQLLLRENQIEALFDNNNSYLWTIDLEKKTFFPSRGFEKIFSFPREAFMSNYELWLERVIPEDYDLAQAHYDRVKSGQNSSESWRFEDGQGEIKWLHVWATPISNDNNKVTHITGVGYDITERKALEAKLRHSATNDHLTGLPNRTILDNYIEDQLKNNNEGPSKFAVFFLDLDRFKSINDNYGHAKGDQVLVEAGRRIKSAIGEKDILTRHGGDEFVLIVPYEDYGKLKPLATKILQLFETPFQLEGEQFISISIGISTYPKDGETLSTLINQADQALYQAKSKGRNTYQFADPTHNEAELRKEKIENELLTILKKDQLEVFYQPKMVLKTSEIYGVEALLRWNHPEFGRIPPDEFIPIAESQGMIHDIGLWVLDEVIKQSKYWEAKGIHLTYAVNVSNVQFESPRFLDKIQQILNEHEMPPEKLTIEITERFMHNAISNQSIKKLRELGLEVSIDDFGTGYSALSILNTQPVDEIKIDKSFIRNLTARHGNTRIVKNILSLSDAFSSKAVAEGIETKEEARILQEMGCLYGQGYLYSRPVQPEFIEELFF